MIHWHTRKRWLRRLGLMTVKDHEVTVTFAGEQIRLLQAEVTSLIRDKLDRQDEEDDAIHTSYCDVCGLHYNAEEPCELH
jgi:hypothetical protein